MLIVVRVVRIFIAMLNVVMPNVVLLNDITPSKEGFLSENDSLTVRKFFLRLFCSKNNFEGLFNLKFLGFQIKIGFYFL